MIILFWVLLGLVVFFVAMRRGPKGARESLYTESKAGQRLITLGIVVVCRLRAGGARPRACRTTETTRRASPVGGVKLTAEEQKGRELFAHSCAVCHTLAAVNAVGRTGPNLDVRVGEDITTAAGRKALVLNAIPKAAPAASGRCPPCSTRARKRKRSPSFVAAVAGH